MIVIGNVLFKSNWERVATFETHLGALRAMINDWDNNDNYRDVPLKKNKKAAKSKKYLIEGRLIDIGIMK